MNYFATTRAKFGPSRRLGRIGPDLDVRVVSPRQGLDRVGQRHFATHHLMRVARRRKPSAWAVVMQRAPCVMSAHNFHGADRRGRVEPGDGSGRISAERCLTGRLAGRTPRGRFRPRGVFLTGEWPCHRGEGQRRGAARWQRNRDGFGEGGLDLRAGLGHRRGDPGAGADRGGCGRRRLRGEGGDFGQAEAGERGRTRRRQRRTSTRSVGTPLAAGLGA